jgi:iron(III) transport system permease protein
MATIYSPQESIRQKTTRFLILFIYVMLVISPVLYLGLTSLYQAAHGTFIWQTLLIPNARSTLLLLKSVGLAGGVAVMCTFSGLLAAIWLWSKSYRWAWTWVWLAFCLAAIPPSLHAISWFKLSAILRDWLGPGLLSGPLKGWLVVLLISIQAYLPFSIGCAYLGLRSIPQELIEAGRSSQPDFKTLLGVALPLSKPALLAGGGFIFLMCLLDYSLPSLLQQNVYAMEIFATYSTSGSPQEAFLSALPLLLVGMTVTVGLINPVRTLVSRTATQQTAWVNPAEWPSWFAKLLSATIGLALLSALGLLLVLLSMSGGPSGIIESVQLSSGELVYSLFTSGLAALMCVIPAWLAARVLCSTGRAGWLVWGLILLPFGVPATLVGAGLVLIKSQLPYNLALVAQIAPSLLYMMRFTPVLALLLAAQHQRRDPLLHEAGLLFQGSHLQRLLKIDLPLATPGLSLGASLVFILSLSELPGTLMVVAPGSATLSMRIYNYLHYGATERVAGLCLALVLSVLFIASAASLYYKVSRVRFLQEN